MSTKRVWGVIFAIGVFAGPQAFAQSIVTTPARPLAVTHERAKGVELRRVSTQDASRLAYEYETQAGPARVAIDPASLIDDIERARKRAGKPSARRIAPVEAAAPAQDATLRVDVSPASLVTPAVEPAAIPQEARKVRIIPLYSTPKGD